LKAETSAFLAKAHQTLIGAGGLVDLDAGGAVTRAYYAAFHAAVAALIERDVVAKTHSGVHNRFHVEFVQPGLLPRALSVTLADLSRLRTNADYAIGYDFSTDEARAAIDRARAFVESVEHLLRNPPAE
jgi:uncharacterized protein (UPF0332 family)